MITRKKTNKPLLNDNQLLLVRSYLKDKKMDVYQLIEMIDGYINENKTATQQYKKVLATLRKNMELVDMNPPLPEEFKVSANVITSMFFTEFIIYVGVIDRKDIRKRMLDLGISIENESKPNLA